MAKTIVDEEMRFSVIINGNEAQKTLHDLEKSTRLLKIANKDLKAEKTRMIALGQKETAEYKKVTAAIKANNVTIKSNEARMVSLRGKIGLTSLTMNQLKKEASMLRLKLLNMTPGSARFIKLQGDLTAVNARMKELRVTAGTTGNSISRMGNGFSRSFAMGASVIATATGMVFSIQKLIDINGKLSDSLADVRKTTGLTKEEVDDLAKSFGMMKTRTSRIELLKLAEEAGRLGITGVKNLKDFVASANEIKVALGDDLSEEAIKEIGKITNIYKVGEQTGKDFAAAMTAVGSSINEVSASGANQAGYLVDYLKRQSGIAAQAKISADQNIGYAATFDEIGQSVEVTATAMNKVWLDMFENAPDYAKIAGVPLKEFNNLLETDANEAMILFLEGLNGSNEGLTVMTEKLKDIEVGGARGVQAIAALSGSTDLLRKRQALAKKALEEATSVTKEYALKNENLAASIEKIKNTMANWFTSDSIITGLDNFMSWFAKFIGASDDASGGVTRFRNALVFLLKLITVVTAAMVTNVTWLKLVALWEGRAAQGSILYTAAQKAKIIATEATIAADALYIAVTSLLTGKIKQAAIAMRAFNTTLKTTPWGLIFTLVAAVVTAYMLYSDSVSEAEQAQKNFNNATAQARKDIQSEISEINGLLAVAQDDKISKWERLKAIKKLNEISPEYLGNLNLENIATQQATTALDSYVESLMAAARAKALKAQLDAKMQELIDKENMSNEEMISLYDILAASVLSLGHAKETNNRLSQMGEYRKFKEIEATKEEIKVLEELYKTQLKSNAGSNDKSGPTGPKEGDTQMMGEELYVFKNGKWVKKVVATPKGDEDKKTKDTAEEQAAELLKIREENEKLKASLITDAFDREMQLEDILHSQRLVKLRSQMADAAELKAADPATRAILIQKNKALNDLIESEELAHQHRIGTILQKGVEEDYKNETAKYEQEKILRETAHNLEMAALGNDEAAKKALQDKFNQEETDREAKHLEELISKMNSIIAGGSFKGFDLELLSEEEKQALLDFLDEANLKLSDLLNKSSSGGSEKSTRIDGDVDVLGFSVDDWSRTFENLDTQEQKLAAAEMAIGAMMNAWSMYSNFVAAKQRVELQEFERGQEKKSGVLERQLDRGYLSQRQYNKAVEELEKETNRKRAEMEYKQAKREKEMAIAGIILNTAMGVAKALAQGGFILGVPWAAIIGGLGAIQLGMAVATPLPAKGFEDGLYPVRREQDGQMFNAGYGGEVKSGLVKKPTLFMAGEKNKPEMIIDNKAWMKMDPDVKNSLYRELSRVKGFEAGYYPAQPQPSTERGSSSSSGDENRALIMVLNRAIKVLDKLEKNGVSAVMSGSLENAKQIQDKINDYNKLRNANKR